MTPKKRLKIKEKKENTQENWEKEKLAEQLHIWYLEACLKPESGMDFNPAAQEPYELLKESQKFIDRYIAENILVLLSSHTSSILEEAVKILEEIKEWPEPKEGAGEGLGPLAGLGMYAQYDADREKRQEQIELAIKKIKEKI